MFLKLQLNQRNLKNHLKLIDQQLRLYLLYQMNLMFLR
jgi:hypothetical protein